MKKIIFSFLTLLFVTAAKAGVTIPESVKHTFVQKFPQASEVNWSAQENGLYEADFMLNTHRFSALLDQQGQLVHAGEMLNWFQLPYNVRRTITNDFQGFDMKLMMRENDQYLAEFKYRDTEYLVVLDKNGDPVVSTKE